MRSIGSLSGSLFLLLGLLAAPRTSYAQTCNSSTPCVKVVQNGGGIGIYADAGNNDAIAGETTSGVAVAGTSGTSYGVNGISASSYGVHGASQSSYGVVGETFATDGHAAVYGGALNGGLAFYGSGDLQITGNAFKPGGGSWTAASDARVKKDIRDLDRGLSDLMRVRPVRFRYNGLGGTADDGREYVGVVAQDLEKIFPEMVGAKKEKLSGG